MENGTGTREKDRGGWQLLMERHIRYGRMEGTIPESFGRSRGAAPITLRDLTGAAMPDPKAGSGVLYL